MKKLTWEQKQSFEAQGFLSYGPFLSEKRIKQLGDALDAIASSETEYPAELIRWEPEAERLATVGEHRKNIVYQIRYPHRHIPLFFEHATDPAILDPLEDLIGPDIVIYNTQALLKPAHHGTSQPWHQDSAYWPIRPCNLVTCWIALDEATTENGCMHFLPGSHRAGLLVETLLYPNHPLNPIRKRAEIVGTVLLVSRPIRFRISQSNRHPHFREYLAPIIDAENPREGQDWCHARARRGWRGLNPQRQRRPADPPTIGRAGTACSAKPSRGAPARGRRRFGWLKSCR